MTEADALLSQGDGSTERQARLDLIKNKIRNGKASERRAEYRKVAEKAAGSAPTLTAHDRKKLHELRMEDVDARPVSPKLIKPVRKHPVVNPHAEIERENNTRNRAIAMAAAGYTYSEIASALQINSSIVNRYVNSAHTFEELREREARYYVIRAWRAIHRITEALEEKIVHSDLSLHRLRDLTGSLLDLKRSVDNAAQIVQVNVQNNTTQQVSNDDMILEYVKANPVLMGQIVEHWQTLQPKDDNAAAN